MCQSSTFVYAYQLAVTIERIRSDLPRKLSGLAPQACMANERDGYSRLTHKQRRLLPF